MLQETLPDAGTGLQLPGKYPGYRLVVPHTNIFTCRRAFTFPSSKIKCSDDNKMLWKRGCVFSVPFLLAAVPGGSPEEQNTVPSVQHGPQHPQLTTASGTGLPRETQGRMIPISISQNSKCIWNLIWQKRSSCADSQRSVVSSQLGCRGRCQDSFPNSDI